MADWYTTATAKTALNIAVTSAQLAAAQEQCLIEVGLAPTTATAPSDSFALGVVFQALANTQSAVADQGDEFGSASNGVRLYPMAKKIRKLLIVPDPDPDDATRDRSRVRSLIG